MVTVKDTGSTRTEIIRESKLDVVFDEKNDDRGVLSAGTVTWESWEMANVLRSLFHIQEHEIITGIDVTKLGITARIARKR